MKKTVLVYGIIGGVLIAALRSIRAIRWLEGVYAALSFFFCLSLPWPPEAISLPVWLHFGLTGALALLLAWKLQPGSRRLFIVGLVLAAYVAVNTGISLPGAFQAPVPAASIVLGLLPVVLQLGAGVLILLVWRRLRLARIGRPSSVTALGDKLNG